MKISLPLRSLACLDYLKTGLTRHLTKNVKRATVTFFALFTFASQGYSEVTPVHVNRTLPKFDPPRTTLEFSANPTEDEFFRARVFAEPLVPIGGKPAAAENSDLAAALLGYAKRSGPDDFSSLTGFLERHPESPWAPALLTGLGIEYYNTAHYSLALDAYSNAVALGKGARDARGVALAGRAFAELAYLDARLGRMTELDALLKPLNGKTLNGSAGEKVNGAREGLWMMQHRPEVAFRCGPLALYNIQRAFDPQHLDTKDILNSASAQKGFSLPQVAELSRKIGLNYQMAYRGKNADFAVPSVIHWKVGHYAALIKQVGDHYLVKDPTFKNSVWTTKTALEAETSGYFLIPPGELPRGWRTVDETEGGSVWGKGNVANIDPSLTTPQDLQSQVITCKGMMASTVHLTTVNLSLKDTPVGYKPPAGPPIEFTVRFNSREASQAANFNVGGFGPLWTCDYFACINDNPQSPLADVAYDARGGGYRTFTGFNPATQSFAYQQYDETLLTRTSSNSYTMVWRDGSKLIFAQPDGSIGTSRNVYLSQIVDPQGNAVTLTYDTNFLLVAITDAVGQVTTLTYGLTNAPYLITQVTDPFGRFATFAYTNVLSEIIYAVAGDPTALPVDILISDLGSITDEIGITSTVGYEPIETELYVTGPYTIGAFADIVDSLTTPYGVTTFSGGDSGTTRFLETVYPDGSRDRVEYNETIPIPMSDPPASVPAGMATYNDYLAYRNTYYWSRNACATSYGDYTKARIYHWLHTEDLSSASGILESTKEPLENRVWRDYAGQDLGNPFGTESLVVGDNNLPLHIGRVLDDGSTQLSTYAYDGFGRLTNSIDPLGRSLSYIFDTNGIDMLEVRQTRAGNNELLLKATYNSQHMPLTATDASGQTSTYSYNDRGQVLTTTDPKNETATCTYDANGYLLAVNGPLPGTNDVVTATYDAYGRIRTETDESGYTLTFDYDNMDRPTRITNPDGTFSQFAYDRLDLALFQDRAGRQTLLSRDNMRHLTKTTDPLGRTTMFEWCNCGSLKSLTDPLGRTTSWLTDVQDRRTSKQYPDGSQVKYIYENTSSRLRQVIDEQQQATLYSYNPDDTIQSIVNANAAVPTPGISFTYDPNYNRVVAMKDGIGTTTYTYFPINASPVLGAGRLAGVDGPLTNDTVTYIYDELGRPVQTAINGVASASIFDAAGRITGISNALGAFTYAYDGSSGRLVSQIDPNGQTAAMSYGNNLQDFSLQQISYASGAKPISQFSYGRDIPKMQITTWSQQAGAQIPSIFTFGYDTVNQLLSAVVTNSGALVNSFAYSYDAAGNRFTEQIGGTTKTANYNALNQLTVIANSPVNSRTNEWDAQYRLSAVNAGANRTEFGYDGKSRLAYIRQLQNGSQISLRRFVWKGNHINEERDASGSNVTKRFFQQGVQFTTGTNAGSYYYTRDHLGSVRELTDAAGNVRARYCYDPYGRRTKVSGDLDADFGFAGMFWSSEASLALTHFRTYDTELGRWLSRDPLKNAEVSQGPNLYAYVANNPVNKTDSSGLLWWTDLPEWGYHRLTWLTHGNEDYDGVGDSFGFLLDSETLLGPALDSLAETGLGEMEEVVTGALEVVDLASGEAVKLDIVGARLNFPFRPPKLSYPGIAGPLTQIIGLETTILTMTDCNTVNGILGLVRQGKGGVLNIYEDQMLQQLEENP